MNNNDTYVSATNSDVAVFGRRTGLRVSVCVLNGCANVAGSFARHHTHRDREALTVRTRVGLLFSFSDAVSSVSACETICTRYDVYEHLIFVECR